MDTRKTYTSRDLRAILGEALRDDPPRPSGISARELEDAAQEAGIGKQQVRRAIERVEQKRGLRSSLIFVALGGAVLCAALILLPSGALLGWRRGSLLLHNQHRQQPFTFEVLTSARVALPEACRLSPEARFRANAYCVVRRVRLEPGRRASVKVRQPVGPCPQVWVRVFAGEKLQRSAIFTLPASIEIDRRGRLDQKGVGAPQMHPSPEGDLLSGQACPAS